MTLRFSYLQTGVQPFDKKTAQTKNASFKSCKSCSSSKTIQATMFLFKKKQDKEESSGQETGLGDEEDSRSVAGSSDYGCSSLGYDDMAANKKEQEPSIAKEETKAVRSLKVLVLLFLAAAAAGVGTAVYFYTSNAEQAQFEVQYRSDASKVLEVRLVVANVTDGEQGQHHLSLRSLSFLH